PTSMSNTLRPLPAKASARAAATVVLPVPPLPVTTCSRTPSQSVSLAVMRSKPLIDSHMTPLACELGTSLREASLCGPLHAPIRVRLAVVVLKEATRHGRRRDNHRDPGHSRPSAGCAPDQGGPAIRTRH